MFNFSKETINKIPPVNKVESEAGLSGIDSALDVYQAHKNKGVLSTPFKSKLEPLLNELNAMAGGDYFVIDQFKKPGDARLHYTITVLNSAFKRDKAA